MQKQLRRGGIRFIHVEIYQDNNPAQGFNRWVKEWRLPTEPLVFLVGRDGRIKAALRGLGLGRRARLPPCSADLT